MSPVLPRHLRLPTVAAAAVLVLVPCLCGDPAAGQKKPAQPPTQSATWANRISRALGALAPAQEPEAKLITRLRVLVPNLQEETETSVGTNAGKKTGMFHGANPENGVIDCEARFRGAQPQEQPTLQALKLVLLRTDQQGNLVFPPLARALSRQLVRPLWKQSGTAGYNPNTRNWEAYWGYLPDRHYAVLLTDKEFEFTLELVYMDGLGDEDQ